MPVGTRNDDLEVIAQLAPVDGYSRVLVRNVVTGVERAMHPSEFKRAKHKLLDEDALRTAREHAGRKGVEVLKERYAARHPNSRYTWGQLRQIMAASGLELLEPVADEAPLDHDLAPLVRCRCGREFRPRTNNLQTGVTRSCGCVRSHAQNDLAAWLEGLGEVVTANRRDLVAPFEIDLVLPLRMLAVEYHGLYWHGEGVVGRERARDRNVTKARRLAELGYRFVLIFEDEWLRRPEAVKGRLTAILGRSTHRVGARGLELREAPGAEARAFFEAYHLQGAAGGRTWGLYNASGLVAAATFARENASRSRSGGEELARFAVRAGWSVPGGFTRLLRHGRDRTKPLVSYSDSRWSDGAVYRTAGFQDGGETPPSYWYFDKHEGRRYHRYTMRKAALLKRFGGDPALTERELALAAGYDRVWDLGCRRWVLPPG